MRLSDVKGKRTLEVIADLVAPVASIAQDEDATELFRRRELPKGMTAEQFVIERMKKAVPALLKGHQDEIIQILASIQGVTPEEFESGMNLMSITKDVFELITDSEFISFLSSFMSQEESGSISENTEGLSEQMHS